MATPILSFVQCQISFWLLLSSVTTFIFSKFCRGNHVSVAKFTYRYGIHPPHKICENTGFHWPVFSRIKTKSTILSLHGRISVCESPYSLHISCSDHWTIPRSSYRKLTWVGFEPTTTEFRSDTLTNWPVEPWVWLAFRVNFAQLF